MPLAPLGGGDFPGEPVQVLQCGHAEVAQPLEQPVQHGHGRPRVRQRPVAGLGVRGEEPGQRTELVVRAFVPAQDLFGDAERVQVLPSGDGMAAAYARLPQKAEIEGRVVRDQHAAVGEFQEGRQDGVDAGRGGDHRVGDPGEDRDERGYRRGRSYQRRHLREDLPAADLDRADLGDLTVGRPGSGGLQVHHDKGDVPQGTAEFLQAGLAGRELARRRLAPGGGRGRRVRVAAARNGGEPAHVRVR